MGRLRRFAARQPVALFLIIAFGWTAAWCLHLWLRGLMVAPGAPVTHLPALAGPGIAALATVGLVGGRAGLARFAGRLFRLPARPRWIWAAIAAPLLVALAVARGVGGQWPSAAALAAYPGAPEGLGLVPVVGLVLLFNGLGEEAGWRGFLFDRWAAADPASAALKVSGLWLVWHMPLFAVHAGMQAMVGPALIGWAISLILGAFALGHLYLAAARSVAIPALFHAGFNVATAPVIFTGQPAAAASALVLLWGTGVALVWGRAALARWAKRR